MLVALVAAAADELEEEAVEVAGDVAAASDEREDADNVATNVQTAAGVAPHVAAAAAAHSVSYGVADDVVGGTAARDRVVASSEGSEVEMSTDSTGWRTIVGKRAIVCKEFT